MACRITLWEYGCVAADQDQITQNKDLDLPTQQELLAQFRCDEIAESAFGVFGDAVRPFRKALEGGGILASLGADMGTHRGIALGASPTDQPHLTRMHRATIQMYTPASVPICSSASTQPSCRSLMRS